jgi:hypothetical protein
MFLLKRRINPGKIVNDLEKKFKEATQKKIKFDAQSNRIGGLEKN